MATTTAAANSSATWLAPESASAPKTLITTTSTLTKTTKGTSDTSHEGLPVFLKIFIIANK
jgi:hypothetical protein